MGKLTELNTTAAKLAAGPVLDAAKGYTQAHVDPTTGEAWAQTKDGHEPLRNAAGAITVKIKGHVIQIALTGHHVFHQYGGGKLPQRRIIPDRGGDIPENIASAVKDAAKKAFTATMK